MRRGADRALSYHKQFFVCLFVYGDRKCHSTVPRLAVLYGCQAIGWAYLVNTRVSLISRG